jgi:D-alanine-D-alanine ligase
MSRVAVLKGGRSLERQVSLASGGRVQDALERLGHEVVGIDVGHDLVARLEDLAPDACFIALHGRDGEDGTVQELLELLGLPYTGSGPAACAHCADKVLAKGAMRRAGIPTPEYLAFSEAAFKELGASAALPLAGERLGFPLVIKPADQGSALGVRVAQGAGELPSALVAAFSYSGKVLLERRIAGRDLAVSVLDGEPLPVVEAIPEGEDAYQARYEVGGTRFACPADLPGAQTARAQELAAAVYDLLGCAGVARVDLMLEEATGALYVLEANAIPGMTATSLLPQAADAAGIGFEALVERMLAPALAARASR